MFNKFLLISILVLFLLSAAVVVVFAENSTSAENIVCVQNAVDKRETAIQTAFDAFSSFINSALQTRKTELLAAWSITDRNERKTAINAVWNKFKKSKKTAVKTFNKTRLGAWTQFTADRKACGALPTGENPGADLSF